MGFLDFKKIELSNGLRVVTIPMKSTKAVSVLCLFNTGSDYETKHTNGIAHFLEHLFFKGTKHRPTARDIASGLDRFGAEFNAFTDREITGYFVTIDSEHKDTAFDIISDILLNSTFPPEEIEKERGVIKEEIKMYKDNPAALIDQFWERLLYGDQPAGWDIGGSSENIGRITRDELVSFRESHYHAKNALVVVAGGITHRTAQSETEHLFGLVPTRGSVAKEATIERQRSPRSLVSYRNIDQTHLMIGARGYSLSDEKRYAEKILSVILGENMSSRLFTEIREVRGLAYAIRTNTHFHTDRGFLVVKAGLNSERVEEALRAILAQVKELISKGVAQEEVDDAKAFIKGSSLLDLEESFKVASNFAVQELLLGTMNSIEEEFSKIDAVTLNDVMDTLRELFVPEKLNLVVLGPNRSREFKRNIKSILESF